MVLVFLFPAFFSLFTYINVLTFLCYNTVQIVGSRTHAPPHYARSPVCISVPFGKCTKTAVKPFPSKKNITLRGKFIHFTPTDPSRRHDVFWRLRPRADWRHRSGWRVSSALRPPLGPPPFPVSFDVVLRLGKHDTCQ